MNRFSALIKPASSLCNMRCRYCFYGDVAGHREVASYGVMNERTTENLIDRVFAALAPSAAVTFAFQGGEPTTAGLAYFRHFTEYAREKNDGRFALSYAIQTNGLVIDEAWCDLFREYEFLVGVSLDADEEIHDFCRLDSSGNGTHARVRDAIRLMESKGVAVNILSVITKQLAGHPQRVFRYYVKNKFRYVQLIPCLRALGSGAAGKYDLPPRLYADFMKQFFRLWAAEVCAGRYFSVRQLDNLVGMLRGNRPEQCGLAGYCTPQFVVEADGGVYPCDFYVLDQYLCGNVNENTVDELSRAKGLGDFLGEKPPAHPLCASCEVESLCGGGCKRYRSFYAQEEGYCPYRDFLTDALPTLQMLARTLS